MSRKQADASDDDPPGTAPDFDDRVVDILSWILDTEARARIFVYLRQHPWSTSEEVAEGTGLYPSTVREALAGLTDDGRVNRRKRESEGAGNNPYEYTAIAPSDLVGDVVADVQAELNALCHLDAALDEKNAPDAGPVTINVEAGDDRRDAGSGRRDRDRSDASRSSDQKP